MELNYLTAFRKVLKHKSFSKAAKELGLSQPAVSFQISRLEKTLGEPLFIRAGGKMDLTMAGAIVDRYSREMLNLCDEMQDRVRELSGELYGPLKIGASSIPGNYILPSLLGSLLVKYPKIAPSITIADTAQVIEMLTSHELDFAFVGFPPKQKGLKAVPFREDEIIIIGKAARGSKGIATIEPDDLPNLPFVMRERGSGTRASFERALSEAGIDPDKLNVVMEVGSNEALVNAVEGGLGVAAISYWAAVRSIQLKKIIGYRVQGLHVMRFLYFVHFGRDRYTKLGEAFIDFVKEFEEADDEES